eukprot:TRINITY_DN37809_c0_g2_i1.p1 TRINITY_DN37809_c0_g2~~TRINITY_DN37809_c0_g2_i1.p1  ORF type:complete len:188 (-),score=38.00 TRINITY_DN37809_c0_g2_i1:93-656(-)
MYFVFVDRLISLCCVFFFFQAEDGIRDAQESRGLGDVYKRQPHTSKRPRDAGRDAGKELYAHGYAKLANLPPTKDLATLCSHICTVLTCSELAELLQHNRVAPNRSHECMIQELARLVLHKKLSSPLVYGWPRPYVSAPNILIYTAQDHTTPQDPNQSCTVGLPRGGEPSGGCGGCLLYTSPSPRDS